VTLPVPDGVSLSVPSQPIKVTIANIAARVRMAFALVPIRGRRGSPVRSRDDGAASYFSCKGQSRSAFGLESELLRGMESLHFDERREWLRG
jgi:hypothetical protein